MADYSNARINCKLFQKLEEERSSDKAPHATGFIEIPVADLNEFFSLAWPWSRSTIGRTKGDQAALRCMADTKNGKPFEPQEHLA